MKHIFPGMVPLLLLCMSTGCSKSSSSSSAGSKTDLLTTQDWVLTVMQHKAVSASVWTDDFASLSSCVKDNRVVFRPNNTYESNEGATKCNVSDPQIWETGSWSLTQNETVLVIQATGGTQIYNAAIETLTTGSLGLSFTKVDVGSGITYQYKETYSH